MKKLLAIALIVAVLLAGAGLALAQGGNAGNGNTLNIPPPPPKPQPNMQYGNTARAALIAEGLSDAAQGNAKIYISEDKAVNVKVNLLQDASPYDLAPTMANLTYMLASMYSLTEKPDADILLKVYDTSNNLIVDAKFNTAKNAFDYFTVPEGAAPPEQQPVTQQPVTQRPGMGTQPGYGGQPGYGQPGYGGQYPMQ